MQVRLCLTKILVQWIATALTRLAMTGSETTNPTSLRGDSHSARSNPNEGNPSPASVTFAIRLKNGCSLSHKGRGEQN